jgi:hypothetical protein
MDWVLVELVRVLDLVAVLVVRMRRDLRGRRSMVRSPVLARVMLLVVLLAGHPVVVLVEVHLARAHLEGRLERAVVAGHGKVADTTAACCPSD